MNSVTVNRNATTDNELANEKYVYDSLGGENFSKFNQRSQNYLKVSVGNDVYIITKYDKKQRPDTTISKYTNSGGYLLPYWRKVWIDRNNCGKLTKFIKLTKNSPTPNTSATSIPPIGDSILYVESSANISGSNIDFL